VLSLKSSNACSGVIDRSLPYTACANSIMLSCELGVAPLLQKMSARAWAYFDQVISPLLVAVAGGFATIKPLVAAFISGLLIIVVVALGINTLCGDCCTLPPRPFTLGS
jgi:hypothetical protein